MVDKWILVVEDDPLVARTLANTLRRFGQPKVVATAQEAMLVLEGPRKWAMALIDLDLHNTLAGQPTEDRAGLAVALHVRWRLPDVTVVLWTAHCDPKIEAEARARGIHWLTKGKADVRGELFPIVESATCGSAAPVEETEALARAALHVVLRRRLEPLRLTPTEQRIYVTHAVLTWQLGAPPARKEVCDEIGMQLDTYKTHVNNMMTKKNQLESKHLADELPGLLRETAEELARMHLEHRRRERTSEGPGDTGRSGTRARVDPDAEPMDDAAGEEGE